MKRVYDIPSVEIFKVQSLGTICDVSSGSDDTPVDNPGTTGGGGNAAPKIV